MTERAIVIDIGSSSIKIGFAGDEHPTTIIPNIVGRPRRQNNMPVTGQKQVYFGEEANSKRGILALTHPVTRGHVNHWGDLEALLHYAFYNELKVSPEDHPILLTETALNTEKNRYKMAKLLFEQFDVPALYVENAPKLALFASGRTSGLVVDIGAGVTRTVPIIEGYTFPHAIHVINLAGNDITEYLTNLLAELGHRWDSSASWFIVNQIKEKLCYVSQDYDSELKNNIEEKEFDLPDGKKIKLGDQQIKAPEILFQPDIIGLEYKGVHEVAFDTIAKCNIDVKSKLYNDIVLTGGTTLMNGFQERLKKELKELVPSSMKLKVESTERSHDAVWLGGSIFASLSTFKQNWITKDDYTDDGIFFKKSWEKNLYN